MVVLLLFPTCTAASTVVVVCVVVVWVVVVNVVVVAVVAYTVAPFRHSADVIG